MSNSGSNSKLYTSFVGPEKQDFKTQEILFNSNVSVLVQLVRSRNPEKAMRRQVPAGEDIRVLLPGMGGGGRIF